MKQWQKMTVLLLAVLVLTAQLCPGTLAAGDISTTPTGYTSAGDVVYQTFSGTVKVTSSSSYTVKDVVLNWGARGEDCLFLTTYAQDYYTGSYSWDTLSALDGGTGTSDAYQCELYEALQELMQSTHRVRQGYQDTRAYYQFTDCVQNDSSQISSFYSGKATDGKWLSQKYNREHVWPKSKCINTNKQDDSADIMLLRATITSENSSRGNSAYGEGGGYFDPGEAVRGDCARMVLYGYVRWGNTGKMWGMGGVMESLDILLKWMEEDPVDTWEMGRNDSVQSITGVRNVFVDFPELAWLLFGQEIPAELVTPSGMQAQQPCQHKAMQLKNQKDATCTEDGYTGDYICPDCGETVSTGKTIPATGHSFGDWMEAPGGGQERVCGGCGLTETQEPTPCDHANTAVLNDCAATCTEDGYTGDTVCTDCGEMVAQGETISATGHLRTELRDAVDTTCSVSGYSGDTYCEDCGVLLEEGQVIHGTGNHDWSDWVSNEGLSSRYCQVCGKQETQPHPTDPIPAEAAPLPWAWVAAAIFVVIAAGAAVVIVIIQKKRT